MGNIGSVCNALNYLGGQFTTSHRKEDLAHADAFILPGVGAFGAAMENLHKLDLIQVLTEQVLGKKKPFLGICLGMQLLAKDSYEQGYSKGLGWIDAHVVELKPSNGYRVPHVGWNNVVCKRPDPLFHNVDEDAHFFFDHSFHVRCEEELILASSNYGDPFVASIQKENILATQFHPEKSQRNGLKLMRNFLNFLESYEIPKKEDILC
jgi:imidazole glycerol-phosphate synthase subunit HisH